MLIALFLGFVVPCVSTRGEMATITDSVGAWVARGEIVVRGKITKRVEVIGVDKGWRTTLKVTEVILGGPAWEIEFYARDYEFEQTSEPEPDVLLALVRTTSPAAKDQRVPPDGGAWASHWQSRMIFLKRERSSTDVPWITDDLRKLTTVEELLLEARLIAAIPKLSDRSTMVWLPESEKRRLNFQSGWLEVSLNEETYKAARGWSASKDRDLAWAGAEVISREYTPENAEALLRFARRRVPAEGYYTDSSIARVLVILNKWGVAGTPGLIRSSGHPFELGEPWTWLSVGCMVLVPSIYFGWCGRRRRWLTVATLFVASVLVVFGVRSYWPQDAVTWGNYEVATERGWLYLWNHGRATAGLPSPLVFCRPEDLLRWSGVSADSRSEPLHELGYITRGMEKPKTSFAQGKFWFPIRIKPRRWYGNYDRDYWEVPLWLMLVCVTCAWAIWRGVNWLRKFSRRSGAGFPVELAMGNEGVKREAETNGANVM
jgi:hypothetical protein